MYIYIHIHIHTYTRRSASAARGRGANKAKSWCKLEARCDGVQRVSKARALPGLHDGSDKEKRNGANPPAPPLTIMSVSFKTVVIPESSQHEIALASVVVARNLSVAADTTNPEFTRSKKYRLDGFSIVRPLTGAAAQASGGSGLPMNFKRTARSQAKNLSVVGSERELLSLLVARLHNVDPDVLIGHNIQNFQLSTLMHRLQHHKITHWSKIGRARLTRAPRAGAKGSFFGRLCPGRLVCDTYTQARDLTRESTYTLQHLVRLFVKKNLVKIDPVDVPRYWGNARDLLYAVSHSENDAYATLQLMQEMEMLPLSLQLTRLGG